MDRRSFLIGSGSILTTAFVDKANWFLRNKNSVVPLVTPTKKTAQLFFVNQGFEYELRMDSHELGILDLTYRQVLERYRGFDLPDDEPITLSQFREIYYDWGITPKMLDQPADLADYIDDWGRIDANKAKSYHYLYGLDLFGSENEDGLWAGDISFIDGPHPGNDYLGVISHDPVSASLLQGRLLELGQDISVEIVDEC